MQRSVDAIAAILPVWLRQSFSWIKARVMPSLSVAAVNVSAAVICIGAAIALWVAVQPSPVANVETLSIEPASHVIDRSKREALVIRRRVTMRRAATIQVIRTWIDETGGITPALDDYAPLEAGVHERAAIRLSPPSSLNPGPHRYRVVLRWCNPVIRFFTGECDDRRLEDIEVLVIGQTPFTDEPRWQDHRF